MLWQFLGPPLNYDLTFRSLEGFKIENISRKPPYLRSRIISVFVGHSTPPSMVLALAVLIFCPVTVLAKCGKQLKNVFLDTREPTASHQNDDAARRAHGYLFN